MSTCPVSVFGAGVLEVLRYLLFLGRSTVYVIDNHEPMRKTRKTENEHKYVKLKQVSKVRTNYLLYSLKQEAQSASEESTNKRTVEFEFSVTKHPQRP